MVAVRNTGHLKPAHAQVAAPQLLWSNTADHSSQNSPATLWPPLQGLEKFSRSTKMSTALTDSKRCLGHLASLKQSLADLDANDTNITSIVAQRSLPGTVDRLWARSNPEPAVSCVFMSSLGCDSQQGRRLAARHAVDWKVPPVFLPL